MAMEEKLDNTKSGDEGFGFNRKRAEGRDESDRNKKNLQLKVRKLNPVNTIAYVQVMEDFELLLFLNLFAWCLFELSSDISLPHAF